MTDPIQPEFHSLMNALAESIDEIFNGSKKGTDRKVAFTLLIANFGDIEGGRVNYISNADRADMLAMMAEYQARATGRYAEAPDSKQ